MKTRWAMALFFLLLSTPRLFAQDPWMESGRGTTASGDMYLSS